MVKINIYVELHTSSHGSCIIYLHMFIKIIITHKTLSNPKNTFILTWLLRFAWISRIQSRSWEDKTLKNIEKGCFCNFTQTYFYTFFALSNKSSRVPKFFSLLFVLNFFASNFSLYAFLSFSLTNKLFENYKLSAIEMDYEHSILNGIYGQLTLNTYQELTQPIFRYSFAC